MATIRLALRAAWGAWGWDELAAAMFISDEMRKDH